MSNTTSWAEDRKIMIAETLKKLKKLGFSTNRLPGRGLSSTYSYTKENESGKLCIRTSQDRWFAFPSTGDGWKTLDDVDYVAVATVDNQDEPEKFEVYLFESNEVRERFNEARDARIKNDLVVRENFGMWVGLDEFEPDFVKGIGSGLGAKYGPIHTLNIPKSYNEYLNKGISKTTTSPEEKFVNSEIMDDITSLPELILFSKKIASQIFSVPSESINVSITFNA